ncbi:S-layer homology domain-containing protein [Ornithinibacillus sp. 179-J 7C1 HS]|uniref:S-layer homology domain-containing protein n=1 Tax=Ornithinibacillus sp. 179-J 7C1 HS TaxID=3142384 RepID=UPI00399FC943
MRRFISGMLVVLLVLSNIYTPNLTHAQEVTETGDLIKLTEDITDWSYDETNIYAITAQGNLKVISRATFEVTNTLAIGTDLSDLELDANTLWIAVRGESKVVKVDLTNLEVVAITLEGTPYSITVIDNKLYYSNSDQHSRIVEKDLIDSTETTLVNPDNDSIAHSFYEPSLASETGVLYVAESGHTSSNIYKLSQTDYSILSQSTYDEGYGVNAKDKNIVMDSDEIFYGGISFDKNDLAIINGTYEFTSYPGTVLDVTADFVFTKEAIYDKDEYFKVSDLDIDVDLVLAPANSEVYLYDSYNKTLHKKDYSSLPTTLTSKVYEVKNYKLPINQSVTDWVLDETSKKIYAISLESNVLYTIDSLTMEVLDTQYIGSRPSDIDLVNGKLYVSNYGSTSVAVINLADGSMTNVITKQNPYRIAADGSLLFYVTEDQSTWVYQIDLSTGSEIRVGEEIQTNKYQILSEPDIAYDSLNKLVYIGESNSTGSKLYSLNIEDLTLTPSSESFSLPTRKLLLDGEALYYAEHQFSKSDMITQYNFNEDVIATSAEYIVSPTGVYSKADYTNLATFPFTVEHAIINDAGNIIVYVEDNQAVYKFASVDAINNLGPTNLLVSLDENNDLAISWDSTTADAYDVFYKTVDMELYAEDLRVDVVDNYVIIPQSEYKKWAGQTVTFSVHSRLGSDVSSLVTYDFTFEPLVPTNLLVQKDIENNIVINWDLVTAESYNVYYKTADMMEFALLEEKLNTNQTLVAPVVYEQWIDQTVTFGVKALTGDKSSEMVTTDFLVDETAPEENDTPGSIEDGDSSDGTVPEVPSDDNTNGEVDVDPTDLIDLDNPKIIKRFTTFYRHYEYKEEGENVALNLHKSVINEMNETGDEAFYVTSDLGSFKLPVNTIDQFTNDEDSYIQVTIRKLSEEVTENINKWAEQSFMELVTQPIDFSVEMYENGTNTTITSYGKEFVERRIPISDPSELDEMMVITLDPVNQSYQPVPTTIEQDEEGQYWAVFHRNGNSIYVVVKSKKKNFTDVEGHWAKDSIEALSGKLILHGVNDTEFKPTNILSRSEYAAMLSRALGLVPNSNEQKQFNDLISSKWYYNDVLAAYEVGIVSGYTDGNFGPTDSITREEMIAMTVRGLELVNGEQNTKVESLANFTDSAEVGRWALREVSIAIDAGLIHGRTINQLAPKGIATRAEAAVVIETLMQKLEF